MAFLLVAALLGGGRLLRRHLLLDPAGAWRQDLWLPAASDPAAAVQEDPPLPVLTLPLPVNHCSLDSLTLLPGVGPVLAGRIAAARQNGLIIKNSKDLQSVKGIGPVLAARLDTLLDYGLHRDDLGPQTRAGKSQ